MRGSKGERWLYYFLLKQQLLKMCSQMGITLAQMLLIAIYRVMAETLP
jgi:hypothetical protein